MKKRTAFIGAILSLIPFGQPLLIKTGVVLSTTSFMISLPEKVNAESAYFYFNSAIEKGKRGDYYGAIFDYTKAIEIDPTQNDVYLNRGLSKQNIGDLKGACSDWFKSSSLGNNKAKEWVREDC